MSSGDKPIMNTITRPVRLRHAPITPAAYSPLTARRRCGHCGERDQWQRLEWGDNPGGFYCRYSPLPEITAVPDTMNHTCTVACALAGVA
jgi:hypothetical protein